MKFLISLLCSLCSISFAGVDGSGTGPRPGMGLFMAPVYTDELLAAGVNGGSSPEMKTFKPGKNVDMVKALGIDSTGKVHFKYQGYDSLTVEEHVIDVQEFSTKYLEALKMSQQSKNWEPVKVESLGN